MEIDMIHAITGKTKDVEKGKLLLVQTHIDLHDTSTSSEEMKKVNDFNIFSLLSNSCFVYSKRISLFLSFYGRFLIFSLLF